MLARYHTVRQYHLGMKPPLPLHLARRQRAGGKASSQPASQPPEPHRQTARTQTHTDRCSGSRSAQNGKVLDRAGFRPFTVTVGRYGGTARHSLPAGLVPSPDGLGWDGATREPRGTDRYIADAVIMPFSFCLLHRWVRHRHRDTERSIPLCSERG